MLLEILTGTSLLFYFLVGPDSPRRKLIQYAAWVSSHQELLLFLFSPKGIRWYLVCGCQVREVSVTKFYGLKAVDTSCSFLVKGIHRNRPKSMHLLLWCFYSALRMDNLSVACQNYCDVLSLPVPVPKRSRFREHVTKSNFRSQPHGPLSISPGERPGACSGLRSGAWPWKRNNGRLGAFN